MCSWEASVPGPLRSPSQLGLSSPPAERESTSMEAPGAQVVCLSPPSRLRAFLLSMIHKTRWDLPMTIPGQRRVLAHWGETFYPFLGHRRQQTSLFLPLDKLPSEAAAHRAFMRPFEDGWSAGPDPGQGQAGSAPPRVWLPCSLVPSFSSTTSASRALYFLIKSLILPQGFIF